MNCTSMIRPESAFLHLESQLVRSSVGQTETWNAGDLRSSYSYRVWGITTQGQGFLQHASAYFMRSADLSAHMSINAEVLHDMSRLIFYYLLIACIHMQH